MRCIIGMFLVLYSFFPTNNTINPNYEIEITKLVKVIAPWAFTKIID